jgi:hypothetical protein
MAFWLKAMGAVTAPISARRIARALLLILISTIVPTFMAGLAAGPRSCWRNCSSSGGQRRAQVELLAGAGMLELKLGGVEEVALQGEALLLRRAARLLVRME